MTPFKHTEGRIVIKVDMESKNSHKMENGQVLRLERGWNNLNRLEVSPVNAEVIDAEYIPQGSQILINHNAAHPSYQIFNHGQLSGSEIAGKVNYYAIPEEQAYFWLDGETWKPLNGFVTALRVFKPYVGILQGIEPSKIKDTLYITSGNLKGKVVQTLRACDYCIIFQDINGREKQLIRCRHWDDEDNDREEIVLIHDDYTKQVQKGKLIVGLTPLDAKPIKELTNA